MNDPFTNEERALLDALRTDDLPRPGEQARVKQKLFAELGLTLGAATSSTAAPPVQEASAAGTAQAFGPTAPVTSGTAAVGAGGVGGTGVVAKALLALSLTLGAGGALMLRPSQETKPPAEADARPAPVTAVAAVASASAVVQSETVVSHPTPSSTPEPVVNRTPTPAARSSAEHLSVEADLLGSAQRALRSGDTGAALGKLREHARRFPNGTLRLEREASLAIAHCQAGNTMQGQRAARRFLQQHPTSPMVQRLESACKLRSEP